MSQTKWSAGTPYGANSTTLYLQFEPLPQSRATWIEVSRGDRVAYIIRKYREDADGNDKLMKETTTNTEAALSSANGRLARDLGLPGAGYAMELAERLLSKKALRRRS